MHYYQNHYCSYLQVETSVQSSAGLQGNSFFLKASIMECKEYQVKIITYTQTMSLNHFLSKSIIILFRSTQGVQDF